MKVEGRFLLGTLKEVAEWLSGHLKNSLFTFSIKLLRPAF